MTLRFNKLSYFKQWSETKHWMIACIVLITYFVWVKYIQCQTGIYFKKITLKNKSAKSMNLSFQQVCSFYMFWIYEVNKLRFFFFFFTFEIQKQQSYQINNQHWIYMTLHIHDTSFKSCQFDVVSITCLAKNCKINLFPE